MIKKILKVFFGLIRLKLLKKEKNKLLVFAEYGKSGGSRTYFFSLLKLLHSQGFNVSILNGGQVKDTEIDNLIAGLGFSIIPFDFSFWNTNFKKIPAGLTLRTLLNYQISELEFWISIQNKYGFDGVVLSITNPELCIYTLLLPINLTYILHTPVLNEPDNFKKLVIRKYLGENKKIITVSDYAKKCIEDKWVRGTDSAYIYSVYNFYFPKYQEYTNIQDSQVKRVLTIGAVEDYKNPELFFEIAKKTISQNEKSQIEFIWAGEGSLLPAYTALSSSHPKIKFIGNIENVENLYQNAAIYLQPSLLESHGIATLGAMYYGLPCVVSDKGGLKESVADRKNGYVISVNRVDEFVDRITQLLHNNIQAQQMGKCGRQLYDEHFTPVIWETKMKELIVKKS